MFLNCFFHSCASGDKGNICINKISGECSLLVSCSKPLRYYIRCCCCCGARKLSCNGVGCVLQLQECSLSRWEHSSKTDVWAVLKGWCVCEIICQFFVCEGSDRRWCIHPRLNAILGHGKKTAQNSSYVIVLRVWGKVIHYLSLYIHDAYAEICDLSYYLGLLMTVKQAFFRCTLCYIPVMPKCEDSILFFRMLKVFLYGCIIFFTCCIVRFWWLSLLHSAQNLN